MKYTTKEKKPCEKCGYNRWKTLIKSDYRLDESTYECRNCGHQRHITKEQWRNEQG